MERKPIPVYDPPGYIDPEDDMAIDWGDLASGVIDVFQGQQYGGNQQLPYVASAPTPRTVTVDTQTGKVTPCKRRRRRRLLTSSDLADLASLKAIVGGGAAMNAAVVKAVRR